MSKIPTKHGGAAFPHAYVNADGESFVEDGMSFRDYFAAQSLPVLINDSLRQGSFDPDSIVGDAWDVADAMLKARAAK